MKHARTAGSPLPDRFRLRQTVALLGLILVLASTAKADQIVSSFDAVNNPEDVEVSPDGNYLYVSLGAGFASLSNGQGERLIRYSLTSTGRVSASYLVGLGQMALRPVFDRLYVIDNSFDSTGARGNQILVYTPQLSLNAVIPLGNCTAFDVSFEPSGTRAYVSCSSPASLKVIDVLGGGGWGQVIETINLEGAPRFMTVTNQASVGVRVYVAIEKPSDPEIAVVNPTTGLVSYVDILPPTDVNQSASQPIAVAATQDGSKIFVTLQAHRLLTFQASNPAGTQTQTFLGDSPRRLTVIKGPSAQERVYISKFAVNTDGLYSVARFNAATNSSLGDLTGFYKNPQAIVGSPDGTKVFVACFGWAKVDVIATDLQ